MKIKVWMGITLASLVVCGGVLMSGSLVKSADPDPFDPMAVHKVADPDPFDPMAVQKVAAADPFDPMSSGPVVATADPFDPMNATLG